MEEFKNVMSWPKSQGRNTIYSACAAVLQHWWSARNGCVSRRCSSQIHSHFQKHWSCDHYAIIKNSAIWLVLPTFWHFCWHPWKTCLRWPDILFPPLCTVNIWPVRLYTAYTCTMVWFPGLLTPAFVACSTNVGKAWWSNHVHWCT